MKVFDSLCRITNWRSLSPCHIVTKFTHACLELSCVCVTSRSLFDVLWFSSTIPKCRLKVCLSLSSPIKGDITDESYIDLNFLAHKTTLVLDLFYSFVEICVLWTRRKHFLFCFLGPEHLPNQIINILCHKCVILYIVNLYKY